MSALSLGKTLRNGSSVLALSTIAMIGAEPALANPTDGIYGGGSTLASLTVRQVADCYAGYTIPATTVPVILPSDPYTFDAAFDQTAPTPGLLPTTCTNAPSSVLLAYAGVGSGAGQRGYVSNDPTQLFRGANLLPANNPRYFDSTLSGGLANYPYPRVDFGAGDSPLPANLLTGPASFNVSTVSPSANWTTLMSTTTTITTTTVEATLGITPNGTVTYPTTSFGQPIQLPLFAAPVAIAVNLPQVNLNTTTTTTQPADGTFYDTNTSITWTIKSQFAGDITTSAEAGGRIQLSTAQICAIFSGLVTDWNSTAQIAYLKSDGTVGLESFADANTWHAGHSGAGTGGGTAYASATTPINIVYRKDGSGTSFIFTNYLKTVCPLLDDASLGGTNKYATIFGASNLPNNSFTQLINNVTAQSRSLHTVAADGSDAVAAAVRNGSYGYIGYLSNDFVAPYNPVTTSRPDAASLQNDYQRYAGIYHPGQSSSNFIAATPTSADAAWRVLDVPNGDFNAWNVYGQVYSAGTDLNKGDSATPQVLPRYATVPAPLDISGLSRLPLAPGYIDANTGQRVQAYSLVGTAYGYVYSCYGTGRDGSAASTRVTNLVNYLKYHYGRPTPTDAKAVIENNGFEALPSSWAAAIDRKYLGTSSSSITAYGSSPANGCSGVTGTGAH